MPTLLRSVKVKNYRSLADVELQLQPINVLFGPNGAGKSSFLDTISFMHDCAIRGADEASSSRSHGIGLLYDGAGENVPITISLKSSNAAYEVALLLSDGRIVPYLGETLWAEGVGNLINRPAGSDKARFKNRNGKEGAFEYFPLRDPEMLSLGRYLDFEAKSSEAKEIDNLLKNIYLYHCRSFNFYRIKQIGSAIARDFSLSAQGDNLWAVLRNIEARRLIDARYDTIMEYMQKALPQFNGVIIETTGAASLYGRFIEKSRHKEIDASRVADGHIQMLLLLTALFSQPPDKECLLLFDEPDLSLHPWALAVFADAVKLATSEWNRQVIMATHSPVLLSQFAANEIIATETKDGRTTVQFLSDKPEIQDLLEEYAAGSLYMAQVIAPQEGVVK